MDNEEVVHHTLWCLSYLSDGDSKQIKAILELDVAEIIVDMMGRDEVNLKAPALRAAGNLVTEVDELTAVMVDKGVIPALYQLLNHPKNIFRKEACWAFSNILAGSAAHIEEVFNFNNRVIIKKFFHMIYNDVVDVSVFKPS